MSGFEYLFTFYGLLLGIAVANVATGFADMWRGRDEIRPGISVPLLGLFVLLAGAQQWVSFWGGREALTMGPQPLLVCIGVALPYIFVSQAMFPRQEGQWTSLDAYYTAHRRVLMASLAMPPLVSLIANIGLWGWTPQLPEIVTETIRIGVPFGLMFTRREWLHRLGLLVLSATAVTLMFLTGN